MKEDLYGTCTSVQWFRTDCVTITLITNSGHSQCTSLYLERPLYLLPNCSINMPTPFTKVKTTKCHLYAIHVTCSGILKDPPCLTKYDFSCRIFHFNNIIIIIKFWGFEISRFPQISQFPYGAIKTGQLWPVSTVQLPPSDPSFVTISFSEWHEIVISNSNVNPNIKMLTLQYWWIQGFQTFLFHAHLETLFCDFLSLSFKLKMYVKLYHWKKNQ